MLMKKTNNEQETSGLPFKALVPSEISKNELIKHPKISGIKYPKNAD